MIIYALVVTYNRKKLLCECMDAILNQTRLPDKIIVVDNASTDGTDELFLENAKYSQERIIYLKMDKNTGGSGGFYEGIKFAYSKCDYIWLMDDDTIPYQDTLEGLCESLEDAGRSTSFLASTVFGPEGEAMNLPVVDMKPSPNGYPEWYFYLHKKLVKIKSATFVSLLINTKAIAGLGLPMQWYFIWGDDTEYTLRLTKYFGPAYFSGKSKVLHKRFNARDLSIREEENPNRIKMYFYFYRNMLINKNEYESKKSANRFIIEGFKECLRIMLKPGIKYRSKKVSIILKGISAYMFKHYDYQGFADRMKMIDIKNGY